MRHTRPCGVFLGRGAHREPTAKREEHRTQDAYHLSTGHVTIAVPGYVN
jgi:hypothetical protein